MAMAMPTKTAPHFVALHVWGAAFIVAGLLAVIASFKLTPAKDSFGFLSLMLVGTLWVINCLTFFALGLVGRLRVRAAWSR